MTEITFYMHIFITLFSLLNPIGLILIFLAITTNSNVIEKKAIIKKTAIAVVIILLLSAYLGSYILEFFGINGCTHVTGKKSSFKNEWINNYKGRQCLPMYHLLYQM